MLLLVWPNFSWHDVVETVRPRSRRRQADADIGRRGDAVRREVGRAHGQVVGDREVVQPAAEVADLDRHARQHLLLDRGANLPVVRSHAPAFENLRVDGGGGQRRRAERLAVHRPQVSIEPVVAGTLRRRAPQVAVRRGSCCWCRSTSATSSWRCGRSGSTGCSCCCCSSARGTCRSSPSARSCRCRRRRRRRRRAGRCPCRP